MRADRPSPAPRELRSFAIVTGAMLALVFGLLLPWMWGLDRPRWPWLAGTALAAWGVVHPRSLGPLHAAWMRAAEAIGGVNNRILLGIVFFAIVTPLGALRRTFGADPLTRARDARAASYRRPKARRSRESLERPF